MLKENGHHGQGMGPEAPGPTLWLLHDSTIGTAFPSSQNRAFLQTLSGALRKCFILSGLAKASCPPPTGSASRLGTFGDAQYAHRSVLEQSQSPHPERMESSGGRARETRAVSGEDEEEAAPTAREGPG
ncbi:unnamed protein product [Pipistrellus nathusii]|uniref:Uncharacterized protein n=1 Tax=Pipistrellus nathusii TaxID=59473 RepID=A0ABP0ADW5_PIPNA